jgi:phosphoglycerate dehydrogenase-like enzyme
VVKVVFTTNRGARHQEDVIRSAPDQLEITMLHKPEKTDLITHLQDAAYLISERSGVIDAEIIENAPNLKLIQRLGSLTFDIDIEEAAKAGIAVCFMPLQGVIQVAEHVMMQILVLAKKIREVEAISLEASPKWGESKRTDENTFAYNWSKRTGVNHIWGRTVGILGFGEIGVELTRRLTGWGCSILYYKRTRFPSNVELELKLEFTEPREMFSRSDYLVNLLPYSKDTDRFLSRREFEQMRDGAFLVSCGSGSTIDEAALASVIRGGKLGGAALDTFEWEPLQADNPLITAVKEGYNILLTPHTAAGTGDSKASSASRAQDYSNIIRHITGEPLHYRVV